MHASVFLMEEIDRKKIIGERLREYRERRGWTRADLVRELSGRPGLEGYNAMKVKRTEEGLRALQLDEALELSALFDVPVESFAASSPVDRKSQLQAVRLSNLKDYVDGAQNGRKQVKKWLSSLVVSRSGIRDYFELLDSEGTPVTFDNSLEREAYEEYIQPPLTPELLSIVFQQLLYGEIGNRGVPFAEQMEHSDDFVAELFGVRPIDDEFYRLPVGSYPDFLEDLYTPEFIKKLMGEE